MRFAYADPPYLGHGKKDYGDRHAEAHVWDDPSAHLALVEQLVEEYPDGWAISLDVPSLRLYLQHVPVAARVAPWCKTFHQILVNVPVQYSWEPVIFHGGRPIKKRNPMVRDWLSRATARVGFKGAKPDRFNRWILDLLGYVDGEDTLDDLFPGREVWRQHCPRRPFATTAVPHDVHRPRAAPAMRARGCPAIGAARTPSATPRPERRWRRGRGSAATSMAVPVTALASSMTSTHGRPAHDPHPRLRSAHEAHPRPRARPPTTTPKPYPSSRPAPSLRMGLLTILPPLLVAATGACLLGVAGPDSSR